MTNYDNNERILTMANYIISNKSTIRGTAKVFNIPKSTVHHDLSTKLKYINYPLFIEVKQLLDENFKIKHIHGGESTKIKYQKIKSEININDKLDNFSF